MSALTERLIAARDQIKPLTRYGEDAVWRPAQDAHECMADAANAISVLEAALRPFADLGVGSGPDDEVDAAPYHILRGAIRNARVALAKAGAQ